MSGKPLLEVLAGNVLTNPPIWLMRQAGRYLPEYRDLRSEAGSFLDLCYNSEFAKAATLQPVQRFKLDAAILFSDILVIPHALGQELKFVEGEGPRLTAIRSIADLRLLSKDLNLQNLSAVYETIEKVVSELDHSVTLIGFAGAPWTVATYMIEGGPSKNFENIKHWAFSNPNDFEFLIHRLVEVTVEHLSRQIEAGAEVIQLFESWAGILPEKEFVRWCIKPVKTIVDRLKRKHPNVPIIGFPRGAGTMYSGYARRTLIDAVSVDYTIPPRWIAEELQKETVVQGNLDPHILQVGGNIMVDAVRNIKTSLSNGPFIFNLGHGVLPNTPPNHVSELIDLVHEH